MDEESDDEVEVTAKEVYDKLLEAWLNEKFSPELLESKMQMVECMLAQVKELEEASENTSKDLATTLQRIELERVKFIMTSYLRKRLHKIEQNVAYILQREAENQKLSTEELIFAKSFRDKMNSHLNNMVLQNVPANMQNLDEKKQIPVPNLDEYVFMKVLEKQEQVLLDPEEDAYDLEESSQHIVRYKPVASLLQDGMACLI